LDLFNFIKLDSLNFDLNAVTSESGRVYQTPSGNHYPSITTVLSEYNKKSIQEWKNKVGEEEAKRVSSLAARKGTNFHSVCEKYLLNELTDMKIKMMMPDMKEMFSGIRPFLDEYVNNIYGIEQALYSDVLKVAGRCDCIAEWNNKISIIDWKTSSKLKEKEQILNYFMQATAYSEMFEERTGIPIEQIVIAINIQSEKPQIFIESKYKYLEDLQKYIGNYHNGILTN
jgi:ATP-dependent exoDNAse (exonuclease V) beta subunit